METNPEVIKIIVLADNDLKTAIINMFKDTKQQETIQNEPQRDRH